MLQSPPPRQTIEDLSDALQTLVLLSASLEKDFCDSLWAADTANLSKAVRRAALAADRLLVWARSELRD